MISLVSLFFIVVLSILVTRIAAVVLTHTGLARETARFQARSAFTGVGFTTGESEKVVSHPVRRRVVLTLMLLGNAGIVTAISSLMLAFVGPREAAAWLKLPLLALGVLALWALSSSRWFDRQLSNLVASALRRWTRLDVRDYASLMHVGGDYRLAELAVSEDDWIACRTLGETRLRDEGIVVLGIGRTNGTYVGAPTADTQIVPGDTLLIYGRARSIERIDERGGGVAGDWAHLDAAAEQESVRREEAAGDPVREEASAEKSA